MWLYRINMVGLLINYRMCSIGIWLPLAATTSSAPTYHYILFICVALLFLFFLNSL